MVIEGTTCLASVGDQVEASLFVCPRRHPQCAIFSNVSNNEVGPPQNGHSTALANAPHLTGEPITPEAMSKSIPTSFHDVLLGYLGFLQANHVNRLLCKLFNDVFGCRPASDIG